MCKPPLAARSALDKTDRSCYVSGVLSGVTMLTSSQSSRFPHLRRYSCPPSTVQALQEQLLMSWTEVLSITSPHILQRIAFLIIIQITYPLYYLFWHSISILCCSQNKCQPCWLSYPCTINFPSCVSSHNSLPQAMCCEPKHNSPRPLGEGIGRGLGAWVRNGTQSNIKSYRNDNHFNILKIFSKTFCKNFWFSAVKLLWYKCNFSFVFLLNVKTVPLGWRKRTV